MSDGPYIKVPPSRDYLVWRQMFKDEQKLTRKLISEISGMKIRHEIELRKLRKPTTP